MPAFTVNVLLLFMYFAPWGAASAAMVGIAMLLLPCHHSDHH